MFETKELKFGNITLELRFDPITVLKIESALDESLMTLFVKGQGEMKLPPINKILKILHRANKKSGITEKMMIDNYVKYIEDGNSVMDLQDLLQQLLEDTGFFGKETKAQEETLDSLTQDDQMGESLL